MLGKKDVRKYAGLIHNYSKEWLSAQAKHGED